MFVLNQTLPQPTLNARSLVLRLIPENQKVVDNVYDAMVIQQSFKNGLKRKRVALGERRLRAEENQTDRDDCSFEARHSKPVSIRQECATVSGKDRKST